MADRKGTRVCGRCLSRGWYRKGKLTVDCERGCPRVEPTPVRLSADMLGEEDIRMLKIARVSAKMAKGWCEASMAQLATVGVDADALYMQHLRGAIDKNCELLVFCDRLLGKGE